MADDPLSDVLRAIRLTGAIFFDVVAKTPWVAEQPPRDLILPKIRSGAGNLIAYHVITEGRCFANIVGEEPIVVEAGEIIVFTKGHQHVVSSDPGMRSDQVTAERFDAALGGRLPLLLNVGQEGPVSAKFVCGFLACDAQPFNPLLDNLPSVIKISAKCSDEYDWLDQFIRLATAESADKRAGGESVLARLSELMFIEVVRRYLETLPAEQIGWLAALRDPFIGKALSLIHTSPSHNWTIEDLAKNVGLSRSVLAERFADIVGMPPMHYLTKWRMQVATSLLSGSSVNIARVAAETGYGSEEAFSRAFKKIVGMPPSAWRQRVRQDSPVTLN